MTDPKMQTFIAPTVACFSLVLLTSALMNIPNQTPLSLALQWSALGLFGTGYSASYFRRLRGFDLDPSDTAQVWLWNFALPRFAAPGLDAAAVGVLLLVPVGLHNAWNVTLRMVRLTPS